MVLNPSDDAHHFVAATYVDALRRAGTSLAGIVGCGAMTVSSAHHQAIRDLAPSLRASAVAEDGIVESVELEGNPFLLGVQWHPEADVAADPLQLRLLKALVAAASGWVAPPGEMA